MDTQPPTPLFEKGENVRIGNEGTIGTVNDIIITNNSVGYRVTIDGVTRTVQEKYLNKILDKERELIESFVAGRLGDAEDFHLFQTWFRLKRPVEGNFYSYLASKTIFNPYQFKPLRKFLSPGSESRLFIADEVGVGKTIETGIIIIELLARGIIDHKSPILIVCPNSLGPKWAKEMKQRFNLHFHIHDGRSLHHFFQSAKDGIIPDGMIWSIVSLPLLRTEKHSQNLDDLNAYREMPLWSLIVIDESHHMRNASTLSFQIGTNLSTQTEMMVMLSATPLNLRDEDLFNQMHILNPSYFSDLQTFSAIMSPQKSINRCCRLLTERTPGSHADVLSELHAMKTGPLGDAISMHPGVQHLERRLLNEDILTTEEIANYDRILKSLSPLDNSFTRTLKREAIEHRVTREPIKVPVTLTDAEMWFHDEVIELTKELYLERGGEPCATGFITNIPRRMASSCLPAMREYLDWSIKNNSMLDGFSILEDDFDDDQGLEVTRLSPKLRTRFIQLRDDAGNLDGIDTKFDNFIHIVKNLQNTLDNPQIIVFSFFIRTLKYLEKRLKKEGYRVGLIYGDTPSHPDGSNPTRYQIMDAFEKGEFEILLSSEVGGEGLDFQFCQAIINYDLPYNPMKIEQRIGRIDRFGQREDKIFVASMYISNSVDENIYNALYDRIHLVEESIGILEPILGTQLADLQNEIIQGILSEEQLQQRIKDVEISVEQAKLEMDRFEKNRIELMGEDQFSTLLQDMNANTEFVQPIDALWLTQRCLTSWKGCKFKHIDDDSGFITLSKEIVLKLIAYCRKPGSEGIMEELSRLTDSTFPVEVIFNGSVATQRQNALFLPPCGFWISFLLNELEEHEEMPRVFSLYKESGSCQLDPGEYLVLFFEVMLKGFTTEISLSGVPVNSSTGEIPVCDYQTFSRDLMCTATSSPNLSPFPDPMSHIDIARITLETWMEDGMEEMRAENTYRIHSRINSIEKATTAQIDVINTQLQNHYKNRCREDREPDEKFVRMKESQKDTLKKRRDEKIRQFRNKDELVMTSRLIGIATLQVQ